MRAAWLRACPTTADLGVEAPLLLTPITDRLGFTLGLYHEDRDVLQLLKNDHIGLAPVYRELHLERRARLKRRGENDQFSIFLL